MFFQKYLKYKKKYLKLKNQISGAYYVDPGDLEKKLTLSNKHVSQIYELTNFNENEWINSSKFEDYEFKLKRKNENEYFVYIRRKGSNFDASLSNDLK